MDPNPAPDGEEYFITALYSAHARWGSGQGIYDYRAEADRLLHDVRNRADIAGRDANGRDYKVGALFHREHKLVRFTPDTSDYAVNGDHTDPSYHLPAFYEVWARVGPAAEAGFWREAATASRDFLAKAAHPVTGLVPDYAEFDGRPKPRHGNPSGADFQFDAWRTAMNWAVDHAWWAADPRAVERSDRLQAFFANLGLGAYVNRYHLDGRPIGKDRSLGLVATNAAASLAASHARAWRFVDALWGAEPPQGKWRYYDGMLYLMSMLHVSGQFRAYLPADARP
jgi:oligosaccharide reducing-end xylanase